MKCIMCGSDDVKIELYYYDKPICSVCAMYLKSRICYSGNALIEVDDGDAPFGYKHNNAATAPLGHRYIVPVCEYCGNVYVDDKRGNCISCGGKYETD